jgi:uncharacterized protein (UPF0332 family)
MNEQVKTLINYRLEISLETLEDARLLLSNNRYRSAMNRLYYSCFYAVTALLLSIGLSSKTHKGLKLLFNQHFVKTNIISEKNAVFYSKLFNFRQENDYHYVEYSNEDRLEDLFEEAESFISIIKSIIEKNFHNEDTV